MSAPTHPSPEAMEEAAKIEQGLCHWPMGHCDAQTIVPPRRWCFPCRTRHEIAEAIDRVARARVEEEREAETVICAAVRMPDGTVFRGHRHGDALRAAQAPPKYKDVRPSEQGFVTSRNRYVDRAEGLRLQLAAGVPSADSGGYRGELFSEDLY